MFTASLYVVKAYEDGRIDSLLWNYGTTNVAPKNHKAI